jgi:hypothetical protein
MEMLHTLLFQAGIFCLSARLCIDFFATSIGRNMCNLVLLFVRLSFLSKKPHLLHYPFTAEEWNPFMTGFVVVLQLVGMGCKYPIQLHIIADGQSNRGT